MRQYRRKAEHDHDPNDRGYDREVERRIKRMDPQELDALLRGEELSDETDRSRSGERAGQLGTNRKIGM
jgi:hypothetical protein